MGVEVQRFCRKFYKATGMFANSELEIVRNEGECGFVRNHCFNEEMNIGELTDFSITQKDFRQTGTIEVPRTYTAEGSVSISAQITGQISEGSSTHVEHADIMEFDFTARKYYEADVSMTFNRSFSYVFSYENVAIWELRENKLRQVKQAIMEAWKDKIWPRNYTVVTGYYEAEATTLLISRTRNVTANGTAIIGAEAGTSNSLRNNETLTQQELSKNMSLTFTASVSSQQDEVVDLSDTGETCPILTLRKLKRRGRGRQFQLVEL